MKVIINDISIDLEGSVATLEKAVAYLAAKDFRGLAAAVNNTVIPRPAWETFQLKENDIITIIHATQGG